LDGIVSGHDPEVSTLMPRGALGAARSVGISVAKLFEGLHLTEQQLMNQRWTSWEEFSKFSENLEREFDAQGLAGEFGRFMQPHMSFIGALVGVLVPPSQLYRALFELGRYTLRNMGSALTQGDEHLQLQLWLRPQDRSGEAFFRFVASAWKYAPLQLGLPSAEVSSEIGPRKATFWVRPPAPGTLSDRIASGIHGFTAYASGQLSALSEDLRDLWQPVGQVEGTFPTDLSAEQRLLAAQKLWELSDRQYEVLRLMVHGKSNRQMGEALDCSERTIEVHVAQILKRVQLSSRSELIARFWAESSN
jgi:DNA-binding CsgD family transcriptional regulator